jgi:carbon starvation protein
MTMSTLAVAILSFAGFLVAYHTYGRWLGRRVFGLDARRTPPSEQFRDDADFVPTRRSILFGHHFTSIAGTGPIVGPAIAVFWGWLPALLWVLLGSIFIGAVHDFGAMVVSLRNEGRTIGEVAGRVIGPRAKVLLLAVLLLELWIVLAIFGLVIALIFAQYPQSVLAVWTSLPLAVAVGLWVRRRRASVVVPALAALAVIYAMIYLGGLVPVDLTSLLGVKTLDATYTNAVVIWSGVLFAYCFVASVLPVWVLLQPRDYINANQLFLALALLLGGIALAGAMGQADLITAAPMVASGQEVPADAPPILPFLFITIACGAVSGFHSLVSSGTSSKQLARETDARAVGYGGMLLEGALAVIVILACCAGVGMGALEQADDGSYAVVQRTVGQSVEDGSPAVAAVTGREAWRTKYPAGGSWAAFGLGSKIGAFVEGGANFLGALGIPLRLGVGILAVMVACFAATTLDTATRLQRYVLQEFGQAVGLAPLRNKYVATGVAVVTGLGLAILPVKGMPGMGGMILWPVFGATNQLLAGLGFVVVGFYLLRKGKPTWFLAAPAVAMLVLPAWAMLHSIFAPSGYLAKGQWLLAGISVATQLLLAWLVVEAALVWGKARREGLLARDVPPSPAPMQGD